METRTFKAGGSRHAIAPYRTVLWAALGYLGLSIGLFVLVVCCAPAPRSPQMDRRSASTYYWSAGYHALWAVHKLGGRCSSPALMRRRNGLCRADHGGGPAPRRAQPVFLAAGRNLCCYTRLKPWLDCPGHACAGKALLGLPCRLDRQQALIVEALFILYSSCLLFCHFEYSSFSLALVCISNRKNSRILSPFSSSLPRPVVT